MESYENFYPGLFNPPEHMPETAYSDLFVGYHLPMGKLGAGASAMTVNQIMEVFKRINTGAKVVEAGPISPDTFEKIPKQHFKEINRLAKLTDAEITWHAPIIDPAGLSEGGSLSEETRKQNEKMLWSQIQRIIEAIGGRQPITIHATAGVPANYTKINDTETIIGVAHVLRESVGQLKFEEEIKPEHVLKGEEKKFTPERLYDFLDEKNREIWNNNLEKIELMKVDIEPIVSSATEELYKDIKNKKKVLEDSYAYRYFGKHLNELSDNEYKELENYLSKDEEARQIFSRLDKLEAKTKESGILFENLLDRVNESFKIAWKASKINNNKEDLEKLKKIAKELVEIKKMPRENAMTKLTHIINDMKQLSPKILVPAEDFAREKASETLSNIAVNAYQKFGDKAPIISLENIFPGQAFSTGKSLRQLIEKTREKFVEKMKNKLGEKKAREIAEQLIGATWDIGHVNIWKRFGKKPEEIKAELEEIKPFIKHIHITDNFGFSDSHLPPGMGNIEPEVFKELKELMEKKGTKGVLEVPTLALPAPQGFGVSPYPYSLAALGSPLYSYEMAPYWNQVLASDMPAYFTGYGPILPEKHFEIYGASFTGLPAELGGQTKRRGFAEAPME